MASRPAVSDETLARSLGFYAGMVGHILTQPERWLGLDDDPPPSAGFPARALDAARDRAFGETTPASPHWQDRPLEGRVDWWLRRIAITAGLAAAAPRFAGALADRIPLQAALSTSATGLAVCATAREHGVTAPQEWVPLLARVLFDKTMTEPAPVPADAETEQELTAGSTEAETTADSGSTLGRGARRAAATVWRLARTLYELQALLDQRPRGSFLSRTIAKVPVVGVAGGWLDQRGALRKASRHTSELLRQRPR